jgi:hypothetical protein
MISFNQLGNLGRLGNQMFQYASLRGIAANRGFNYCIPSKEIFGVSDLNVKNSTTNIHTAFDISKDKTSLTHNSIVEECGYHFDEKLFNTCEDNVDLFGYFQSEKYFKHIETEIRKTFFFDPETIKVCSEFLNTIPQVISLHIRRGDYLNLQDFHPTPSIEYYEKALNKLPDVPVIIFSDDIEWVSKQQLFDSNRFYISESNTADFDMCLMSMCNYHIIANSSFSWWGSWLAQSEHTIAPKNWFGPSLSHHDTSDLYCNGWEII